MNRLFIKFFNLVSTKGAKRRNFYQLSNQFQADKYNFDSNNSQTTPPSLHRSLEHQFCRPTEAEGENYSNNVQFGWTIFGNFELR